ncbi:MAG: APC family permease [Acidobacteria bacterium]|nr:APC family permease [Acidobacteriota bacterium]
MNGQTTNTPQLRSNSLGLSELVFQAITHIAPASNVIFAFPIIALKAGPVMPVSLLLATIVCLFIGNTVSQFSSYMPSSGGYYSFATRGLGSRPGFMATWSYLVYEIPGNAGLTGFLGYFVSDMLHTEFRINVPWYLISLATIALVWTLTYRGIQLSARMTEILGGVEKIIILAMSITFLIHPGKGSSYTAPLNPANAPNHFIGVLAGMVFSVLALSGFEAPAPMAQEAKRPANFIAKAVTLSLLTIGGFYIFCSYAAAIGWGTGDMAAFASNANPYYVLGHAFWGIGWWSVVLALINSAVGVGLAATNATSRVMYTMGRAGTPPAKFARIHPVHQTPTFAIGFIQIACSIAILLVGFLLKPDTIFGFLETVATLAVIVLYVMSNLALTRYMRREQPAHFSMWRHGVVPWIATLCLLPVLFVTIYPQPTWPDNVTPYVFAVALVLGFGYMKWRESSNPGALDRAAAMLTRGTHPSE